jgi:hypothetical protein
MSDTTSKLPRAAWFALYYLAGIGALSLLAWLLKLLLRYL